MDLQKIYTDSDFENAVVPAGQILLFSGLENGKVVTRYKDSSGNFGTLSGGGGGGGGADVTLGQIDANGKFQPLAFDGQTASNSGDPETVESYYGWNGTLPSPSGGIRVIQGGDAVYYKCASVNTANKTWSGYLAVLTDGVYTFESTATTGLTYGTAYTPKPDGIYNADATVQVQKLWDGSLIPQDGLVFYAPLTQSTTTAETGQSMTVTGTPTFSTIDGIPCATFDGSSYYISDLTGCGITTQGTMCFWARISSTKSKMRYVHLYDPTGSREYAVNYWDGSFQGASDISVDDLVDHWAFFVRTLNGTSMNFYLNLENKGSVGSTAHTSEFTKFGVAFDDVYKESGTAFEGSMASVRIYNRVLSAEELNYLYNEFTPTT